MSEQAPQEQVQPVTATQLIEDLQSKGADIGSHVGYTGHGERHIIASTRRPDESIMVDAVDGSLQMTHDNGHPLNAGSAHTSQKKDGLYVGYGGHIAPTPYDYSQPRVVREGTDPKTGERVRYEHKFKDTEQAGQLIAKLAAKRIEKTLPPQESAEEHKAA